MISAIAFPDISPIIFEIELFGFNLALRWYALAYIVGITLGWFVMRAALRRDRLWPDDIAPMPTARMEDLLTYVVIGVIAGGRLGYVLFYQPGYYLANPIEIPMIWTGGLSFHGGFLGVVAGVWLFSRRNAVPLGQLSDAIAIAAPPAVLLVRLANFVNAELWGRPTDLPWGVIFPGEAAQTCPGVAGACARHPSQLYEAGLEGLLLGSVLILLAFAWGGLKKPWLATGTFFAGYGIARFIVEFVRQPDAQFQEPGNPLGWAFMVGDYGLTMGQILSLPMILVGVALIVMARRR
ncbi:MAG: prolipoprotein diacylglyceryl transferase [Paracoccaceae bacterium]